MKIIFKDGRLAIRLLVFFTIPHSGGIAPFLGQRAVVEIEAVLQQPQVTKKLKISA